MKKKVLLLSALVVIIGTFLGGCAVMKDLVRGKWCDVYGNTVLEFDGDKMKVTYGKYTEEYTVRARGEYDTTYIENADGSGSFGIMSTLTVSEDGTLLAYEEILDADGHRYVFVRESEIDEYRAVKDFSTNKPKEIESDEIVSFSLSLSYYKPDELDGGRYSFYVHEDEGEYYSEFEGRGDSYVIIQDKRKVKKSFIKKLVKLIKKGNLCEHNGEFFSQMKNDVKNSLSVTYASGERLSIRAGSGALDRWCVNNDKFMELAMSVVPKSKLK